MTSFPRRTAAVIGILTLPVLATACAAPSQPLVAPIGNTPAASGSATAGATGSSSTGPDATGARTPSSAPATAGASQSSPSGSAAASLPRIPSLTVRALPVATPSADDIATLTTRLQASRIDAGTPDGCHYLVIVGWSATGMDLFSGVAGSSDTRTCGGDPTADFASYRDGKLAGSADFCAVDCPASTTGDYSRIDTFYSSRPALKVVDQGDSWTFTRTTWGAAVS